MSRKHPTRIGDGAPAVVVQEALKNFRTLQVIHRGDDIHRPTDWRIHEAAHSIVVHLGGRMDRLETELDGHGGSRGPALPGEVWTIPAGRSYASHACGGVIEYAVLRLDPRAQDLLKDTRLGALDISPVAGRRDDFLHHATRQLIHTMRAADDISAMLAESLGHTISLHILQALAPGSLTNDMDNEKEARPGLGAHACRALRDHVHDRLGDRISLDQLAALAGLTTHQFLIAFRKSFGTTPGQYIIQQRLRAAQHHLLHSRKDITTIALECGFSSHSHLTSSFTRTIGCTPRTFRTTARKHQIPLWRAG